MSAPVAEPQIEGTGLERLWSVTTLLKMGLGASPPIVDWNCTQTAIAAVDRRSTLEAMLREGTREDAIKWLVAERWNVMERHMVRGNDVHRAAEAMALGVEPVITPGTEAYVEQLARWIRKWQPEFLMAEAPVYNVTHRYAGTLDGVMRVPALGDRRFVYDYKTTPKGPDARSRPPYSDVALQLCAYAHAERVGVLADQRYDGRSQRYYLFDSLAEHEPMPEVDGALAIIVTPFDCFAVPVSIGPNVWTAWLHVIAVAAWQDRGWRPAFSKRTYDNAMPVVAA